MPELGYILPLRYARSRVVDTAGVAQTILVNKSPTDVCFIACSAETPGTAGRIRIYDGFDAGGALVWQGEPAYGHHARFNPPIRCQQGLFIDCDAGIACFTVGYWDALAESKGK